MFRASVPVRARPWLIYLPLKDIFRRLGFDHRTARNYTETRIYKLALSIIVSPVVGIVLNKILLLELLTNRYSTSRRDISPPRVAGTSFWLEHYWHAGTPYRSSAIGGRCPRSRPLRGPVRIWYKTSYFLFSPISNKSFLISSFLGCRHMPFAIGAALQDILAI